ncbi:MAG TPA: hypothetical protein VFH73_06105, partial [Polyangia bacterium]|nr:hypothetical protein [Polyangia bacterium]
MNFVGNAVLADDELRGRFLADHLIGDALGPRPLTFQANLDDAPAQRQTGVGEHALRRLGQRPGVADQPARQGSR